MGGVVLPEYKVHQVVVGIHNGQAVELVGPDDVVGLLQGGFGGSGNKLLPGGHKGSHLLVYIHPADPVVTAGNDAQQLSARRAVIGDGHGGEAVLLLQSQNICQGVVRGQIGCGGNETGFVVLDLGNHGRLALNGLGTVDKADAAFLGQSDGQGIVGDGLHHGRGQGDVQADGALLLSLPELDQGSSQGYLVGNAILGRIAGNQKILAEGVAGFGIIVSHWNRSSLI